MTPEPYYQRYQEIHVGVATTANTLCGLPAARPAIGQLVSEPGPTRRVAKRLRETLAEGPRDALFQLKVLLGEF